MLHHPVLVGDSRFGDRETVSKVGLVDVTTLHVPEPGLGCPPPGDSGSFYSALWVRGLEDLTAMFLRGLLVFSAPLVHVRLSVT